MSKLIILRGNSGSGKTTVSKILQEKFGRNTMLISHDMVRMQILHAKDVEALPLIMQLLKYGRQNSEITILEGILPVEVYMPLFELAVQEYGKDIFAFYYDLPFEETLQRHATKPNRADFGEQDMRRWWKEKDFIDIIPEKVITKDLSVSDTVDMIYNLVADGEDVPMIKLGYAETDITPDIPLQLVGFNRADNTSKGILKPLLAQVSIWESEKL